MHVNKMFLAAYVRSVLVLMVVVCAGMATSFSAEAWWGGSEKRAKRELIFFPTHFPQGRIVVSFGDRRLYYIHKRGYALSYPIAIPRREERWAGTTSVSMKKENPSWTPTQDMLRKNPRLPTWIPGGHPMNPLGVRALYLGTTAYRIHGTDAPWTIGGAVSSGCIRMYDEDVLDLYPRVSIGAVVDVTEERFTTAGPSRPRHSRVVYDDTRRSARDFSRQ